MGTLEFLSKLTTRRLLAYYKSQRERRKLVESQGGWDPKSFRRYTAIERIEWDNHLADVKSMLNKREHIEK